MFENRKLRDDLWAWGGELIGIGTKLMMRSFKIYDLQHMTG